MTLIGRAREFFPHFVVTLRRVEPRLSEEAFFKRSAPLFHRAWLQAVA